MRARQFVEITWDDTTSRAFRTTKDALPKVAKASNRGWIITEDKKCVTLAASIVAADEGDEDELFGDVTVIPRGCITGRKVMRWCGVGVFTRAA